MEVKVQKSCENAKQWTTILPQMVLQTTSTAVDVNNRKTCSNRKKKYEAKARTAGLCFDQNNAPEVYSS